MDSTYIGSCHHWSDSDMCVPTRKRADWRWYGNMRTRRSIRNNHSDAGRRNKNVARNIVSVLHTSSNPHMDLRRDIQKIELDQGRGFVN